MSLPARMLAALALVSGTAAGADLRLPPGFEEELVASALDRPTSFAIATDGRIFVAEKAGRIRVVSPSGVLLPTPFATIPVTTLGDRGLLGIALDPDFLANGFVYVSYVTQSVPPDATRPESVYVRVSRFTANGSVVRAGSEFVLEGGIRSDSVSHCGGGLAFDVDGMLFVSTGDGASFSGVDALAMRTFDLDSLNGKILRIDPHTGAAPPDNPFYAGPTAARSKVWCFGLRNPFHIATHPNRAGLLIDDVGLASYEEIDLAYPGANFGWPCFEGPLARSDYGRAFPDTCGSITVAPALYAYSHSNTGACITGGAFAASTNYPPGYRGDYYFEDYVKNTIERLVLGPSGDLVARLPFAQGDDTFNPVDLREGPDGDLYVLNIATRFVGATGRLTRIRWVGSGNHAPVAGASAAPAFGYAPLDVAFSSDGSSDADGTPLSFRWDFDDGTSSTEANPAHRFETNGTHRGVLAVSDGRSSRTAVATVVVGSSPPTATILAPTRGVEYEPGETIRFAGHAFDPDEGALPASALQWSVLLHHDDHVHPLLDAIGSGGSFTTEEHADSSDDFLAYEIALTATDSSGLSTTHSVTIRPAPDVAIGRPATASSWTTLPGFSGAPEDAVDGLLETAAGDASGWHSALDSGEREWWQVDLGESLRVRRVAIQPRVDLDEPEARRDFEVLGSDDSTFASGVSVLASQGSEPFAPLDEWSARVSDRGAYRYVRVQKTRPDALFSFLECRVFGAPPEPRDLAIVSAAVDLDPTDPDVDGGDGAIGQALDVVAQISNEGTSPIAHAVMTCSLGSAGARLHLASLEVADFDPAPGVQPLAPGATATVRMPFAPGVLAECGSYSLAVSHAADQLRDVDGGTGDAHAANDRAVVLDAVTLEGASLAASIAPGSETVRATEAIGVDVSFRGFGPAGRRRRLTAVFDVLESGAVVRPSIRTLSVARVRADVVASRRFLLSASDVQPPLEVGHAYAISVHVFDANRTECARATSPNRFTLAP